MHPAAVGPYQIERELGRGGMGVVFLAMDTRLVRRVAIKSLPAHLASDAERLTRFQREAKVLASLSHPGIGAIYGLEEASGSSYLILEYFEGQTLARRLERGALPIAEALSIARQIAEALEAAHEKGVIHRDLKPANVMLTLEGVTKVLDFGLARADEPPSSSLHSPLAPDSPTLTSPASPTIAGVILGSPGYMSPEQALGKTVDKRSDIFAFGCVLFEMLTGERVFAGENAAASLGAVLHVEPTWSRLPAATPARIHELLRSALDKDRRQRLHDIGDARLALEQAIQGREWTSVSSLSSPAPNARRLARAIPWVLTSTLLIATGVITWRSTGAAPSGAAGSPHAPIRLRADLPEAPPTYWNGTGAVALSDDGAQIVYASALPGQNGFAAVRRLSEPTIRRLPFPRGPDARSNASTPSDFLFSTGGKLVGTFDDCVFLTPVTGGEPTRLYTGQPFVAQKGGAWTPDGLLFAPSPSSGLVLISERGGQPQTVTVPDASRGEVSHRYPDVLPGGRLVLMTIKKEGILSFDDAEIALLDLQTRQWKTILRGGSFARYVPTGHIMFARNGSIMAAPFDLASGEVTGAPVAVVPGVITSPGGGVAQFAVSRDPGGGGTLAYLPGGADDARGELVWLRPDGSVEPTGAPVMSYAPNARVSPDGTRIAASVLGAFDAVFIYDLNRSTISRLSGRGNCALAAWTPDGSKVAYVSDAEEQPTIYLMNPDGGGSPERVPYLRMTALHVWGAAIDGTPGIVTVNEGDIWFVPFRETPGVPSRRKLVGSPLDESHPRVSPDGKWLSYASNESGQYEIYVTPFPAADARWQVSIGGGLFHSWMPGGDGIIYIRDADRAVLRTPFKAGPPVDVGSPVPMFKMPKDIPMGFDVHPDGTRFLAVRNLPPRFAVTQVSVILNWFEELKAKVPTASR